MARWFKVPTSRKSLTGNKRKTGSKPIRNESTDQNHHVRSHRRYRSLGLGPNTPRVERLVEPSPERQSMKIAAFLFQNLFQIMPSVRFAIIRYLFGRALCHKVASPVPALGADVNNIIR